MIDRIFCITPIKHLKGVYEYLETFGKVDYEPEIDEERIVETDLTVYDVIFCNPNKQPFVLNKKTLQGFSGVILTASTGLNHIDLSYCKENNIQVLSHTKDLELINQLPSTSELAFGLMLSLLRKIPQGQKHVSEYGWDYTNLMGRQVKDLNIGIVGYGRLGRMMHKFCESFDAKVYVCDPYVELYGIPCLTMEEMFSKCDVISLHVHVSEETREMVNKKSLESVTKPLYIINTSRGDIVNERDVVLALERGVVAGYGTDVIVDEFGDVSKSPIIKAMNDGHNVIVTPHVGGMTWEGQQKAYMWSISKLRGLV